MAYGTINVDLMTTSDGVSSSGLYGFKNRIINGAMVIDQRNAGASVTPNNSYTLDRWSFLNSQTSKFTVQQNAGSVTPPAGFTNYLGITSTSAYSVASGDYFQINYSVEGYNIADLNWGTANAQTVTLSFWVRSSLTGTFAGLLLSSSATHSYPFIYTISSANTWEQKTITISGPQVASWNTTNGTGLVLRLAFGLGSSFTGGTNNNWNSGLSWSTLGTSVVGTNGATFYITGVQLEKGSTATSFDYRPYGTELQLCQRYYWRNTGAAYSMHGSGTVFSTTQADIATKFSVSMRAIPTVSLSSTQIQVGATAYAATGISGASGVTTDMAFSRVTTGGTMTVGYGAILTNANSSTGYLDASAEL